MLPAILRCNKPRSLYLKSINLLAGADNLYRSQRLGRGVGCGREVRAAGYAGWPRPVVSPLEAGSRAAGPGRSGWCRSSSSARAGYYRSYSALKDGPGRQGRPAVKVIWVRSSATGEILRLARAAFAVDARRVAMLSSRDEVAPSRSKTSVVTNCEMRFRDQPYGNSDLKPLGWTYNERPEGGTARIVAEGELAYTRNERSVNRVGLILLDDEEPTRLTAVIIGATSGLAAIVALLAAGLVEQRRRAIKQRLASQAALQAANDMLRQVQDRTAELRAAQDGLSMPETGRARPDVGRYSPGEPAAGACRPPPTMRSCWWIVGRSAMRGNLTRSANWCAGSTLSSQPRALAQVEQPA